VEKNEWLKIEHMIRHGYKQKKLIDMPGFTAANLVTPQKRFDNQR
jgi:hypothetical protein